MAKPTTWQACRLDGCEEQANVPGAARGLCRSHYHKDKKWGDPYAEAPPRQYPPLAERFWAKVDKEAPAPEWAPHLGNCWWWTGATNDKGYGSFWLGADERRTRVAHGWAYDDAYGKVPEGLELDHLCHVRCCVRPDHLEAVPHEVNIARGESGQYLADRSHCLNGHEYTPDNTRITEHGYRICRACQRETTRKHRAMRC